MLIFSRNDIMIYSLGGLETGKATGLKCMMIYSKKIYGSLVSIDMMIHPETKQNLIFAMLSDGRLITLKFNTKLFCLETVAMHELNTHESVKMNCKHPNTSDDHSLRIDASENSYPKLIDF